jgi:uncharacterized protein YpmS
MIGTIVFIVLALIIIAIISIAVFLIYWFSRKTHSEKAFSTVNTSETITPTKTNGKNLSTIGSKTTEKSINSNEKQLSNNYQSNKSTKPTASVGSGIQKVQKKKIKTKSPQKSKAMKKR